MTDVIKIDAAQALNATDFDDLLNQELSDRYYYLVELCADSSDDIESISVAFLYETLSRIRATLNHNPELDSQLVEDLIPLCNLYCFIKTKNVFKPHPENLVELNLTQTERIFRICFDEQMDELAGNEWESFIEMLSCLERIKLLLQEI